VGMQEVCSVHHTSHQLSDSNPLSMICIPNETRHVI
jgi:hypothetical protein